MVFIDAETKEVNDALKKIGRQLDAKTLRRVLSKGAKPYINAARKNAPQAARSVFRYNTSKISKSTRAPKGSGTAVAEYTPGNLKRSMKVLPLRRLKQGIIVGPKRSRNPKGKFGSSAKVDGWYAHFIEGGTKHIAPRPFAEPAWQTTKTAVIDRIMRGLKTEVNKAAL